MNCPFPMCVRVGVALGALIIGAGRDARACPPPPPPMATLQAISPVNEGAGSVTVTISLSHPPAGTATLWWSSSWGTATGSDFVANNGMLSFTSSQLVRTVTVPITNDALDEPDETFLFQIHSPSGCVIASPWSRTVTIVDNDAAPTVRFTGATSTANEGSSGIGIAAMLSAASGWPQVSVAYTVGGTATGGGADHALAAGTLIFDEGSVNPRLQIAFSTVNDTVDEPAETVVVTLTANAQAAAGAVMQHTHTIADNDAPPTVRFTTATSAGNEGTAGITIPATLSVASGWPQVNVSYTVTGSATGGGVDHTLAAGSLIFDCGSVTPRTPVGFSTIDDAVHEPAETVVVTLTANAQAAAGAVMQHTHTIAASDAMPALSIEPAGRVVEGGNRAFRLSLSNPSAWPISVPWSRAAESTASEADYDAWDNPVTILPGSAGDWIEVEAYGDGVRESEELLVVQLGTAAHATLATSRCLIRIEDNDLPNLGGPSEEEVLVEDPEFYVPLVWFDESGNMRARGEVVEHVPVATIESIAATPGGAFWWLANGIGETVALVQRGRDGLPDLTGTLWLAGELFTRAIPSAGDLYAVEHDGSIVASFDEAGNIYLAGGLLDERGAAAATGLTAEAVSDARVNLAWNWNGTGATGWEVWMRPQGSYSYILAACLYDPAARTAACAGLAPQTGYTFIVRAVTERGFGAASNEATACTFAAAGFRVSAVDPAQHSVAADGGSGPMAVRFNRAVSMPSVTSGSVVAQGRLGGRRALLPGASARGADWIEATAGAFAPGESVEATVRAGIESSGGLDLDHPFVWRFRQAALAAPAYFGARIELFGDAGAMSRSLAVGDLDGDRSADLIVTPYAGRGRVYLNDGDGAFDDEDALHTVSFGATAWMARDVLAADFDGDGRQDLVAAAQELTPWVIRNTDGGAGFPAFAAPLAISATGTTGTLVALDTGDLNGDGWSDLAAAYGNGRLARWLNTAGGVIAFGAPAQIGDRSGWTAIETGDVDGDGDLDLIGARRDGIIVYLNDGAGGYAATDDGPGVQTLAVPAVTTALLAEDLNGDGWLDIVGGFDSGEGAHLFLNDAAGAFPAAGMPLESLDPGAGMIADMTAGDVDGDGDLDLVFATARGRGQVLLNDRLGNFTGESRMFGGEADGTGALAAADLDGDGDLDIAAANSLKAGAVYFNEPLALDFGRAMVLNMNAQADVGDDLRPSLAADGRGPERRNQPSGGTRFRHLRRRIGRAGAAALGRSSRGEQHGVERSWDDAGAHGD